MNRNLDWSNLGMGAQHPLIKTIRDKWQLLLDRHASETECHLFLKKHANLFLVDGLNTHIAVSKLKLGSSLELDFAVPEDKHSYGLFWELIELKSPSTAPYTKNGNPSATLTAATQQIRDWKQWIISSRSEAKKIFSLWQVRTQRQPNFKYTIIIGTRENSARWIDKRNNYAIENNISIRSYDYLTERLSKRPFFRETFIGSSEWRENSIDDKQELANPFVEAFTDSNWKKLLQEPDVFCPHFISQSCKQIIKHRTVNQSLISSFEKYENQGEKHRFF